MHALDQSGKVNPVATKPAEVYDVCIIGGGPGGLAALSACTEPYSLDLLSGRQAGRAAHVSSQYKAPRVCVVDPESWLTVWRERFENLNIEWLRSPTMAHSDIFDPSAMLTFACQNDRMKDLLDSGCVDRKLQGLPEAANGSYRLPSNKLFLDFCEELTRRSPHDFVKARAASIQGTDGQFTTCLENGQKVSCNSLHMTGGTENRP